MKAVWEKWNSQGGASILAALLFLLVCVMVSASILMAAASNAGRIRSVREEQQKYLALSSALQLVCDKLLEANYYGQYTYTKTPVYTTVPDGAGGTVQVLDHYIHTYAQTEGSYSGTLSGVLPLLADFDSIFAEEFRGRDVAGGPGVDAYIYTPLTTAGTLEEHGLVLEPDVDGDHYPGLTEQAAFTVQADENYTVRLTAAQGGSAGGTDNYQYVMEAELTPSGTKPVISNSAAEGGNMAGPMAWKLGWIAKKEVMGIGP